MARKTTKVTRSSSKASTNQGTMAPPTAGKSLLAEVGAVGLRQFGGYVYEEILPQLQGQNGVRVFKEMALNDATVSSILFAVNMFCRQVPVRVSPAGAQPTKNDSLATTFIDQCLQDMSMSWQDTLNEILSMLQHGWSWHEIVYKIRGGPDTDDPTKRSQYNDGRVGWRKWALRAQDSLLRWDIDNYDGSVRGMFQLAPPLYRLTYIPIEKSLLFRSNPTKGNPEGVALALHTPIPTPEGWKPMGVLEVGDRLYGSSGEICNVVAKSEVWFDRPVYNITFSSGDHIIADENHLWSVTTFNDRVNDREPRICTTKELHDRINSPLKNMSFCVGIVPEIQREHVDLPLDPYILGYWLGDGARGYSVIAAGDQDLEHVKSEVIKAGFKIGYRHANNLNIKGLGEALRAAGVFERKHIPKEYLVADYDQRLALLQGLMDSDGYSNNEEGRNSCFCNSDYPLLQQVKELIFSLGGRAKLSSHGKPGDLGGIIRGHQVVQKKADYKLSFYLHQPVHRIKRKLEQQNIKDTLKVRGQFIQTIEYAGREDTVCIETDSPDNLFLAGYGFVPTHNSVLRHAYVPWYRKKNIEEMEAVGIERDLAGYPIIRVPEKVWNRSSNEDQASFVNFENIAKGIHRNESEGLILPSSVVTVEDGKGGVTAVPGTYKYDVQLINAGSRRQFDTNTIINRYNYDIARVMLADVIMIGGSDVGSYALTTKKSEMFIIALGAILDSIADIINSFAIPRLMHLNAFPQLSGNPQIQFGPIAKQDIQQLAQSLLFLQQAGAEPFGPGSDELQKYIFEEMDLPVKQKVPQWENPNAEELEQPGTQSEEVEGA